MKKQGLNSHFCAVCGNELIIHTPKVNDTITNEEFTVYKCVKCGLGYTCPQPRNLDRYYDNTYYGTRHGFTEDFCMRRRIKIVLSATKHLTGKKLLDVGCGDAAFLRAMSILGWDAAGTEIHPHVESTNVLTIKKQVMDFSDYAPFDCVTMWHTLEHMRNIHTLLSQIRSLLKPGGKLIIAVPNSGSFQSRIFGHKWLHLDVPRHLYHFDVTSLQACLRAAGFVIDHQGYQELEYDLLGWVQSALNTIFAQPNIFFDNLRGRQERYGNLTNILHLFIGTLFTVLSLPAVIVERLFNRSGTIITVASRSSE